MIIKLLEKCSIAFVENCEKLETNQETGKAEIRRKFEWY